MKVKRKKIGRKYYKIEQYVLPNMTSNTTPSGTVTILNGSLYGNGAPWNLFNDAAFNPAQNQPYISPNTVNYSQRYTFDTPLNIGNGEFSFYYSADLPPKYTAGPYRGRTLTYWAVKFNYSDGSTLLVHEWSGNLQTTQFFKVAFSNSKQLVSFDFITKGIIQIGVIGCIYDFKMTHEAIVEATEENYDFYRDEYIYKVRKSKNKLYALK